MDAVFRGVVRGLTILVGSQYPWISLVAWSILILGGAIWCLRYFRGALKQGKPPELRDSTGLDLISRHTISFTQVERTFGLCRIR